MSIKTFTKKRIRKFMLSQGFDTVFYNTIFEYMGIPEKEAWQIIRKEYKLHKVEWKKEADRIRKEYKSISVYSMHRGRVGETIAAYYFYQFHYNEPGELRILTSLYYQGENKSVLRIMNRHCPILMEENFAFWMYILLRNRKMVNPNAKCLHKSRQECDRKIDANFTKTIFYLSDEENALAEQMADELGVKKPYVTIANRDAAYVAKKCQEGYNEEGGDKNYRNFSIMPLKLAAEELNKLGLGTVRMGQEVLEKVDFEGCIDFANKGYDELLDIYLHFNAKFYLGPESGMKLFAASAGVPQVLVNVWSPAHMSESFNPQYEGNILILMKCYDTKEKRYLNLMEIMLMYRFLAGHYEKIDETSIVFEKNTEQEILDAAMEMNARIDGTWVETEEDKELQEKYQTLIRRYIMLSDANPNRVISARLGTKFLRENQYLLG